MDEHHSTLGQFNTYGNVVFEEVSDDEDERVTSPSRFFQDLKQAAAGVKEPLAKPRTAPLSDAAGENAAMAAGSTASQEGMGAPSGASQLVLPAAVTVPLHVAGVDLPHAAGGEAVHAADGSGSPSADLPKWGSKGRRAPSRSRPALLAVQAGSTGAATPVQPVRPDGSSPAKGSGHAASESPATRLTAAMASPQNAPSSQHPALRLLNLRAQAPDAGHITHQQLSSNGAAAGPTGMAASYGAAMPAPVVVPAGGMPCGQQGVQGLALLTGSAPRPAAPGFPTSRPSAVHNGMTSLQLSAHVMGQVAGGPASRGSAGPGPGSVASGTTQAGGMVASGTHQTGFAGSWGAIQGGAGSALELTSSANASPMGTSTGSLLVMPAPGCAPGVLRVFELHDTSTVLVGRYLSSKTADDHPHDAVLRDGLLMAGISPASVSTKGPNKVSIRNNVIAVNKSFLKFATDQISVSTKPVFTQLRVVETLQWYMYCRGDMGEVMQQHYNNLGVVQAMGGGGGAKTAGAKSRAQPHLYPYIELSQWEEYKGKSHFVDIFSFLPQATIQRFDAQPGQAPRLVAEYSRVAVSKAGTVGNPTYDLVSSNRQLFDGTGQAGPKELVFY